MRARAGQVGASSLLGKGLAEAESPPPALDLGLGPGHFCGAFRSPARPGGLDQTLFGPGRSRGHLLYEHTNRHIPDASMRFNGTMFISANISGDRAKRLNCQIIRPVNFAKFVIARCRRGRAGPHVGPISQTWLHKTVGTRNAPRSRPDRRSGLGWLPVPDRAVGRALGRVRPFKFHGYRHASARYWPARLRVPLFVLPPALPDRLLSQHLARRGQLMLRGARRWPSTDHELCVGARHPPITKNIW